MTLDWAALKHAYGSAGDIPQALRDAVGEDPERAAEAIEHLFSSIYHQGTLYPATPHAVPYLAGFAAGPGTPRRAAFVGLLGAIASTGDAGPEVLADVDAALAREAGRLLPLLDDPDAELRHLATHLLGNLPRECAAEVVPTLRARRRRERSPRVVAGLLAAAGRLDPSGSAGWLAEELAPGKPAAVRAGALWAIVHAGLPWPDAASAVVLDCWLDGSPLTNWIWSDDPFGEIVARSDSAAFAELCRTLLERGTPEAAGKAVDAAYERCTRSRSARAECAPLLAAGVHHPDLGVRVAAARAICDVPCAAPAAADALAAYVADPPPVAVEDANSSEGRLFAAALEILVVLDDPRWREPFVAALVSGGIVPHLVGLLVDSDVAVDSALLAVVRRRLAASPLEWQEQGGGYDELLARNRWSNELSALTRLLRHWGPGAADAVPELIRLVPYEGWWAVSAIAAIGPAASAAVPALTRARDDAGVSWRHRLECAQALVAVTGDVAQLSCCVAEASGGEPVLAARAALRHGLPLDDLLPALRDLATVDRGDDASDVQARIDAGRLLLEAGDARAPLVAAAGALDSGRRVAQAAELAGLIGPHAADLVPRLRELLDDRHDHADVALAIRRVTGEAAPLVDAVRRRLPRMGAGNWLVEALCELGPDAAPLLPELRELAYGDAATGGIGSYGHQVRQDEEERRHLVTVLAELTAVP
ncbi:hypothetical protein ACIBP6_34490 [Nonomuraea terrae]|uniref:hypothetical protein n=1 Tax=Nonomuraea terrae TaxID=2530383 RepID=UPI0037AE797E